MLNVEWKPQNFFYFWTENYSLVVVQKIIQAKIQLIENISYYCFQFLLKKIGQAQYFIVRHKIDFYRLWIIYILLLLLKRSSTNELEILQILCLLLNY